MKDKVEEKVILNGVETTKEEVDNLKESTSSDKNTTVVETGKNQFATRLHD
ncbi:MAG: hypothetical protein PF569_09360 [Candidatus Woesearchaeota archaeon]|jgi:hypothetical protein|nr:hypothetical protein [Candidatus Woesearchaeota archaeon]